MINWTQPKEYFAYGLQLSEGKAQLVLIGRSYHKPTIHHIARRHAYDLLDGKKRKPEWLPKAQAFTLGRYVLAKVVLK